MSADRKGHYLKPANRVTAPGVVLCIVVQTESAEAACGRGIRVKRFHRAYAQRNTYRNGKWNRGEIIGLNSPEEVREWVLTSAVPTRVNWVLCPVASEVLTLIRWWEHAERIGVTWKGPRVAGQSPLSADDASEGVVLTSLVVRGVPDIISYRESSVAFKWVSGRQYFPDGPADPASHRRPAAGDGGEDLSPGGGPAARSVREVDAWASAFLALTDWWRVVSTAPFSATVGGLAWGLLRSWCPVRTLCTHSDSDVHALERSSAFGGRATTWYIGSIGNGVLRPDSVVTAKGDTVVRQLPGPVTQVDVRSMYPTIMRDSEFPCKLQSYREGVPVKDLLQLCEGFGIVARVTIRTQVPEYPYRSDPYVTYPIGQFVTTLTGPELLQLSKDGEIVKCHAMAVYRLGRPFVSYATRLLSLRSAAQRANDVTATSFSKLLANSLAGKLAQRKGTWQRAEAMDSPGTWGESFQLNLTTQRTTRHRHIAGVAFRWCDDPSGSGPHTAAFSYVAALGRLAMRRVREIAPPRSIVSQDTDGLWVLPPALERILDQQGLVGVEPGQLRIEGSVCNARFFGPRHYYTDGTWTLSGFHQPTVSADGLRVEDSYDTSLWSMRTPVAPSETITVRRESTLKLEMPGVDIDPDGWSRPRRNR